MQQTFIMPKDAPRDTALARLIRAIHDLPTDKLYAVDINERKRTRSLQQNAYLWGVCYATILREGGESLAGWSDNDIHEYMLGEWSGWEVIEGFGRKRMKPRRRSKALSVVEFMYFVDFIQMTAADMGIVIPNADPELAA